MKRLEKKKKRGGNWQYSQFLYDGEDFFLKFSIFIFGYYKF